MMGVYIKGMTKKQAESCLKFAMDGWCIDEMPEIIELPPHGRLIDVDTAYEQFLNLMDTQGAINPCQLGTILVDAPTVIEAE